MKVFDTGHRQEARAVGDVCCRFQSKVDFLAGEDESDDSEVDFEMVAMPDDHFELLSASVYLIIAEPVVAPILSKNKVVFMRV